MGVKNFRKFIESKIDDPIKKMSFDDVKIKSVCIDISTFIYKFITAIRRTGKDLFENGKMISHLIGLKNQINMFKKLNIDIVYVFDGEAPKEKGKVLKERNTIKDKAIEIYKETKSIQSYQQSFFITDEIINDTIDFLKKKKIKYVYDENLEADMVCATLVKKKVVDCALSTDWDILVFGSECLLININYEKKYFEYILLKDILKGLDITYDQFVDMIVMSGCDYCERQENMTLNRAYKLVLSGKYKLSKDAKKAKSIYTDNQC